MICLRGCKRLIAQQETELEFLRSFVKSMRTVYREPTVEPAVDLDLKPKEAPAPQAQPGDEFMSLYADRTEVPAEEK